MKSRPRILDLFCGAGGAAMGLYRAGFDVVGVDIQPQPRYPSFHKGKPYAKHFEFLQGDALNPPVELKGFDVIWASPPCQAYTQMSNRWRSLGGKADSHPDLIRPVRNLIRASGIRHYVIENVVGARHHLIGPITLQGGSFGLGVHRPRLFECDEYINGFPQSPPLPHFIGVYGSRPDGRRLWTRLNGNGKKRSILRCASSVEHARKAMGIDWMEWRELCEAIPPAYSKWIGLQLRKALAK